MIVKLLLVTLALLYLFFQRNLSPERSMNCKLATQVSNIAASDPRLVGVLPSWITTLINLLLPGVGSLSPCLAAPQSVADIRADLESAYDPQRGFTPVATHTLAVRARRVSRQHQQPLTMDQAMAIAEHTLETARTADDATLAEALNIGQSQTGAEAPVYNVLPQP